VIREMKYKDIEEVNTLLQEAFEEKYFEMNIDTARRLKHMKRGYILEKLASLLFAGYSKVLYFIVYEDKGKVRAALRIFRYSESTFFFATIAVDDDYKRKGIGVGLMTFGTNLCKKRGGKYGIGVVKEENVASLNMTKKSGFTVYDETYMYILKNPLQYRNTPVHGLRPLKRKDYQKVEELETAIMREEVVEIEGIHKRSVFSEFINVLRGILFGEKFHEYVLEKEDRIVAYAKVSHFVDGSSSMVLRVHGEDYSILKDFTEKVLYHDARERMRTTVSKDQALERRILVELGFEEYSHLYMVYRELRE